MEGPRDPGIRKSRSFHQSLLHLFTSALSLCFFSSSCRLCLFSSVPPRRVCEASALCFLLSFSSPASRPPLVSCAPSPPPAPAPMLCLSAIPCPMSLSLSHYSETRQCLAQQGLHISQTNYPQKAQRTHFQGTLGAWPCHTCCGGGGGGPGAGQVGALTHSWPGGTLC